MAKSFDDIALEKLEARVKDACNDKWNRERRQWVASTNPERENADASEIIGAFRSKAEAVKAARKHTGPGMAVVLWAVQYRDVPSDDPQNPEPIRLLYFNDRMFSCVCSDGSIL